MLPLKKLAQDDVILFKEDLNDLVHPVNTTTPAEDYNVGDVIFNADTTDPLTRGKFLICVEDPILGKVWHTLNYSEHGELDPVSNVHVEIISLFSVNQAVLTFQWTDPDSWIYDPSGVPPPDPDIRNSAIWAKTVIVRKIGSYPTSIYDGEVVGASTVWNQYKEGNVNELKFVDRAPYDQIFGSSRYFYSIIAVTQYDVETVTHVDTEG